MAAKAIDPDKSLLVLDHAAGDRHFPDAVVNALLAALPAPPCKTARLSRGLLLRRLAAGLADGRDAHLLLHWARGVLSEPAAADAASDALWRAAEVIVGDDAAKAAAAVRELRRLVESEWGQLPPSRLDRAAEMVAGEGAVETWGKADAATREKLGLLVGEAKKREILSKLGQSTSNSDPVPAVEVDKAMNALNSSCADLRNAAEDPLPDTSKAAEEVVNRRPGKEIDPGVQEIIGQPAEEVVNRTPRKEAVPNVQEVTDRPAASYMEGPSAVSDRGEGPMRGPKHSIMDRNPTARTYEWDGSGESDSGDPEGPSAKRQLPFPTVYPRLAQNKSAGAHKTRKKWSKLEEDTLLEAVRKHGKGNWTEIKLAHPDIFKDRSPQDLKDKYRNLERYF